MASASPEVERRSRRSKKKGEKGADAATRFCFARDFLFCVHCGAQLLLDSPDYVQCLLCEEKQPASEIFGKETRYTITAEDIRRELKIKPLVQIDRVVDDENVKWAVTNRACPACKHPELEYTNKQLRSADEGQTTFYRCSECGHNFSENS